MNVPTATLPPSSSPNSSYLVELLHVYDRSHRCLGTLIARDLILTAAHCVAPYSYSDSLVVDDGPLLIRFFLGNGTNRIFLVASHWHHPQYYYHTYTGGVDVDPYDVAILQLYGLSSYPPVVLSQSSSLPHASSSPLQLVGLGWEPPNQQKNKTTATTTLLIYLPNEQCQQIQLMPSNFSLEKHITDVSLCALYEQGGGLCPGDSGGPLLMELTNYNSPSDNLHPDHNHHQYHQVGITSYSYQEECPPLQQAGTIRLPNVFVRVAVVWDWIQDVVCNTSLYPVPESTHFRCPSSWPSHDENNEDIEGISNDFSVETKTLTLQIPLGNTPVNRGWILYRIIQKIPPQPFMMTEPGWERPLRFYRKEAPGSFTTETIRIPDDSHYRIAILDATRFFDMPVEQPQKVSITVGNTLLGAWNLEFTNTDRVHFIDFSVGSPPAADAGLLPTSPPTATPPKPAAEASDIYLQVVIQLDEYPTETGFLIEAWPTSLGSCSNITTVNPPLSQPLSANRHSSPQPPPPLPPQPHLIYACYPGTFGLEDANKLVQVNVILPMSTADMIDDPRAQVFRKYTFIMTDNEHDGLEPPAYYEAWVGVRRSSAANAATLVASGNVFFLEDRHDFCIPDQYFNEQGDSLSVLPSDFPNGDSRSAPPSPSPVEAIRSLFATEDIRNGYDSTSAIYYRDYNTLQMLLLLLLLLSILFMRMTP